MEGGVEVAFYLVMCLLQVLFADGQNELIYLLGGLFGGGGDHGEGGGWDLLHKHQVIQAAAYLVTRLSLDVVRAGRVEEEVVDTAGVVQGTVMVTVKGVCTPIRLGGFHVDGVALRLVGLVKGAVCFVGEAVSGVKGCVPVSSHQEFVVEVPGGVDLVLDVLVDPFLGMGLVTWHIDANDVDARVRGWEGDVD